MSVIPGIKYKVEYDGRDITKDISRYLIMLTYKDRETDGADDLQIELEDVEGLWKNSWYPDKGATLKAWIGKERLTYCGEFTIDEVEYQGKPSTVIMKGVSAAITKDLKTNKSAGHENKTLKQVLQTVADLHGFRISGDIDHIQISRLTQHRESDVQFLRRLAKEYGYMFSVKGSTMAFTKAAVLDKAKPVFSLTTAELKHYSIRDKTADTYKAGQINYANPQTHELLKSTVEKNADGLAFSHIVSENTMQIYTRVENQQQADAKALAAIALKNRTGISGTLTIPGNEMAVAGINFQLSGLYKLSGIYHIVESTHKVNRAGGYETDLQVNKVNTITTNNAPAKAVAFNGGGGFKDSSLQTNSI